ncbi:pyrimidodiazepine synthase-like isoform X1 [Leguminivora glycinivorella]|uniref:pyrimidodiazepine synthase-like isoform X1 n=1 Tax=Leguminivora glycinivorella TaxID=1035111 RepID=UPI00200DBD73|nr:pyrimidodiazepine synthase-like isoform X1 [Leguminivora glycinivorella]
MHTLALASWRVLVPVVRNIKYVIPLYRSMAGTAKINFDTRHLKKGDPLPPYNGKLRIYNMRYCPYAQRTILVLNAKQIDYEVVNIDLVEKPEWLTSKSLFGKVPAIEIADGVCIAESLVTSEYLDEVYPQRPLLPRDPLKKALAKIIVEGSGPIQTMLFKILRTPDQVTDEHIAAYRKYLSYIQDELKKSGTKFLGGAEPGFVDYMIWPWFERMVPISELYDAVKIDETEYKLLLEYINNMFKDPAVSQYVVPKDILFKFMEPYRTGGRSNYDLLTKE